MFTPLPIETQEIETHETDTRTPAVPASGIVPADGSANAERTLPIEEYGMLGDGESCALIGRDGSIDWLCWPRLDSPALFASLLGGTENGRWIIEADGPAEIERRYEDDSMVLETEHRTRSGAVLVRDFLCSGEERALIRTVTGLWGSVDMRSELVVRGDYGRTVPWVERIGEDRWRMTAGPEKVILTSPVAMRGEDLRTRGAFTVEGGEEVAFTLSHAGGDEEDGDPVDTDRALAETRAHWAEVAARIALPETLPTRWTSVMRRSLLTLKALCNERTGAMAAAATTSLPETPGGERNWDYRYCWLRDSALVASTFLRTGLSREAEAWRHWLVRTVAGSPDQLQIMYGLGGERVLNEWNVDWLDGYDDASPVRVGNAAMDQFQLDVFGEVADALTEGESAGQPVHRQIENYKSVVLDFLREAWRRPDEGIWEVRGDRQHFVHSKVMAWLGFRHAAEAALAAGDPDRARSLEAEARAIHEDVCERGYDADLGSFTQSYGSGNVDASLLVLPLVGFLPADDPRVGGTVARIEADLLENGLVKRYDTEPGHDGLEGEEGVFLLCSFWLVEVYAVQGRLDEAVALFDRLLGLANDLGLLAEEIDGRDGTMLGNFPQAFSHAGLVNAGLTIAARMQEARPAREADCAAATDLPLAA